MDHYRSVGQCGQTMKILVLLLFVGTHIVNGNISQELYLAASNISTYEWANALMATWAGRSVIDCVEKCEQKYQKDGT